MEEAITDQGTDRLPFFIILFFIPIFAYGTSFGPIPVAEQVRNSQYLVRGKISSPGWAEMDQSVNRPFTHWRLQISVQPTGNNLGNEVIIREAGGEIGEMGYHIAGSANFSQGEDVFVLLKDTNIPTTKEIIGLSSGKYRVEKNDGKEILKNGIGFTLNNLDGKPMSPDEFTELAKRVANNSDTDDDKKIYLNQVVAHEQNTESVPEINTKPKQSVKTESKQTANPPQVESPITEKPITGHAAADQRIYLVMMGLALAVGIFFYRRKR